MVTFLYENVTNCSFFPEKNLLFRTKMLRINTLIYEKVTNCYFSPAEK